MEITSKKEYLESIREFFGIDPDDTKAIEEAAETQLRDFTIVHVAPNGVYCREEGGDGWFRLSFEDYNSI